MDYQIDMHDRCKRKKVFHVHMLHKWHESSAMYAEAEDVDFENLMSGWNNKKEDKSVLAIGEQLNQEQHLQLQKVLKEFSDVFQNRPRNTNIVEHSTETGSAQAVRLSHATCL